VFFRRPSYDEIQHLLGAVGIEAQCGLVQEGNLRVFSSTSAIPDAAACRESMPPPAPRLGEKTDLIQGSSIGGEAAIRIPFNRATYVRFWRAVMSS